MLPANVVIRTCLIELTTLLQFICDASFRATVLPSDIVGASLWCDVLIDMNLHRRSSGIVFICSILPAHLVSTPSIEVTWSYSMSTDMSAVPSVWN